MIVHENGAIARSDIELYLPKRTLLVAVFSSCILHYLRG